MDEEITAAEMVAKYGAIVHIEYELGGVVSAYTKTHAVYIQLVNAPEDLDQLETWQGIVDCGIEPDYEAYPVNDELMDLDADGGPDTESTDESYDPEE